MICSRDIPFWSETLDIFVLLFKDHLNVVSRRFCSSTAGSYLPWLSAKCFPAPGVSFLLAMSSFTLCVGHPLGLSPGHSLAVSSSSRSSDGNSSLLDEGGSASQVPQASVQLAGNRNVVWPDSLSEWFIDGAGLQ